MNENINKHLSAKYSQKNFDHAEKSPRNDLRTTWKREVLKKAEATGNMMGNKVADKITSIVSQNAPKVISQREDVIPKEM